MLQINAEKVFIQAAKDLYKKNIECQKKTFENKIQNNQIQGNKGNKDKNNNFIIKEEDNDNDKRKKKCFC